VLYERVLAISQDYRLVFTALEGSEANNGKLPILVRFRGNNPEVGRLVFSKWEKEALTGSESHAGLYRQLT